MSSNDEQIKYWNEEAGPKWVGMQAQLDAQIGPIGEKMIELAAPRPGERVLDVGCGCGMTTLALASHVAPEGGATGLDISEPMLTRARERAAEQGVTGIEFVSGDAQTHVFEAESIDLVTSRFGVMFFADPVVAFANLHGALRRGGRLTFVCWQPLGENAWMRIPLMAAAPLLPELPPPPEPGAPGPFAFGDDALVRRILADAGFENIELVPQSGTLALGGSASLEDGVDFVLRLGPTARLLANADDELLRGVREAVTKAVEPFATDAGIAMDYATWLVSARHS